MKKNKLIICISIIVIVLIVLIATLLINRNIINKDAKDEKLSSQPLQKTVKVIGKEELEVTGIEIVEIDGEKYVEGTLKNNSNKKHENIDLNVNLFGQNGSEVLSFVVYMDTIEPNATTSFQAASSVDLSEIYGYAVSI